MKFNYYRRATKATEREKEKESEEWGGRGGGGELKHKIPLWIKGNSLKHLISYKQYCTESN